VNRKNAFETTNGTEGRENKGDLTAGGISPSGEFTDRTNTCLSPFYSGCFAHFMVLPNGGI
jgi:hypothetical protein